MSPITLLRLATTRSLRPQHFQPKYVAPLSIREFSKTSLSNYPRKDSQDRNSINTEATEYSKSGTDDGAARQEAAFDPSKTSPESEKDTAGEGNEVSKKESDNPLDVSPANPDVSKPRGGQEGGAERSAGGEDQSGKKGSGGGSPKKGNQIRQ